MYLSNCCIAYSYNNSSTRPEVAELSSIFIYNNKATQRPTCGVCVGQNRTKKGARACITIKIR